MMEAMYINYSLPDIS